MTLWKWSPTAADNDDADSTINLRENQSPSTYNNAVRAVMAAVAKYRDDMSGNLVLGGTSIAYTVTTAQGLTALTDGFTFRARMNATSGATPTLAVDGLAAKAIQSVAGTAIPTGALPINSIQSFAYDSTADAWIVGSRFAELTDTNLIAPAGTTMLFVQTNAPTGWTKGSTHNDKALRVVTGAAGNGGSSAFSTVFASRTPAGTIGGTAISIAQMPLHGHPFRVRNADSSPDVNGGFEVSVTGTRTNYPAFTGTPSDTNGEQIGGSGGGQTHDHSFTGTAMDFAVHYVDVILATKDA